MTLEQATKTAELWKAGKMIGGDPAEVSKALGDEIKRLQELKSLVDEIEPDEG